MDAPEGHKTRTVLLPILEAATLDSRAERAALTIDVVQ